MKQTARTAIPFWHYLPVAALVVYLVLRAKHISLTWDEAYTYFEFVRHPSWLPHDFNYMAANNHLLNTWLMKITVGLFGSSEPALRLPNIMAGGIFFVALLRFLHTVIVDRRWVLPAFFLIALNPYLIDFFTLARGYGIALAMMMCGIVYGYAFLRDGNRRALLVSQLFFVLATAAVLTFVHVLAAATVFSAVAIYREGGSDRWKKLFYAAGLPFIFLVLLVPYFLKLQRAGAFYLGNDVHSPLATFASLGEATAYSTAYPHFLPALLVRLLYVIPVIAVVVLWRQPLFRSGGNSPLSFLLVLTALAFLFPLLQHYTLGSNIISGRAALFYLPLLFTVLSVALFHSGKWGKSLLVLLSLSALTHFFLTLNLRSCFDWREQADVKEAMLFLKEQHVKPADPVYADIISTDLPYDMPVNYYRMRFGMTEFGHVDRREFLRTCGYYYLPVEDTAIYAMADILHYFPQTRTALYRLQDPPPPLLKNAGGTWHDFEKDRNFAALLTDTIFFGNKGTVAGGPLEYSMTIPVTVPDSLKGKLVAATLSCRIRSETRNTAALLVFTAKAGKEESWRAMHVSEIPEKTGEWSITGWTRTLPPGTTSLAVFIWNRGNDRVYMDNVSVRLLSYQP